MRSVVFRIPAHVLARLRERRASERLAHQPAETPTKALSFVGALTQLFESEPASSETVAGKFVASMNRFQIEIEDEHDAFLLDPGMGPMSYLTSDGRVLRDDRSWDGGALHEASENEAIATLVVGTKKTGISDLLSLVPTIPLEGSLCPKCAGERWANLAPGAALRMVCVLCSGRGWAIPSMIDAARARGVVW